jgi:hypothetical protein
VSLGHSFLMFRRNSSFIFKGETILDLGSLRLLRMTEIDSFEMSGTTYPVTWCHILEQQNHQCLSNFDGFEVLLQGVSNYMY